MVWDTPLILVRTMKTRFLLFVTPSVQMDTLESDQCAIKTAHKAIPISLLSATSHRVMVVDRVPSNSNLATRNGDSCGTLSAKKDSMHLHAACVNPNVQKVWQILALPATKRLSVEVSDIHLNANQDRIKNCFFAIPNALVAPGDLDQSAGATAQLALNSVERFALLKESHAQIHLVEVSSRLLQRSYLQQIKMPKEQF